jgi:hypothetical protein
METTAKQVNIGIDIGRVIMAASDEQGRADTSFLKGSDEVAMRTPPNRGAFEVIGALVERAAGRVWLVSKCGPRIQALTRRWMHHHAFYAKTGMVEDNVRFCLERRDKALHARELALTHFIDDRLDVHEHLRGIVPSLYLFGHQAVGSIAPPWVTPVLTWGDVRRVVLEGALATPAETRCTPAVRAR